MKDRSYKIDLSLRRLKYTTLDRLEETRGRTALFSGAIKKLITWGINTTKNEAV